MRWTWNGGQRSSLPYCVAVGCLTVLAAAGCVERKERITIAADRSVTIELEYEGNPQELSTGDAMPLAECGWDVTLTTTKDDDEERQTLRAKRTFAPGAELPGDFAAGGDPDADLYLSFPTTLKTQRRGDGVYYHFRRVYTPRRWAYLSYWDDRLADEIKDLSDKPVEEMTQEERIQVARAIAGVEGYRHVEFAGEALKKAEPDLAPHHRLLARRAILNAYEEVDWSGVVDRYMETPEEERDEYFEQASKRISREAHEALLRSLREEAGLDDSRITRFERAFDRARRYYDVTNSLGGHHFEVRVKMPGLVVAHNADKLDDNGEAVWEFKGNAFRDRPFELLVTSRLQPAPETD